VAVSGTAGSGKTVLADGENGNISPWSSIALRSDAEVGAICRPGVVFPVGAEAARQDLASVP